MIQKLDELREARRRGERGFTIIEVLIVLAIAGLIMLIVFLAIPALNRNQRNSARNSDASRWAGAVTECLANRNGVITACDTDAELEQGTLTQLTDFNDGDGLPPAGDVDQVRVTFGNQCNAEGTDVQAGGGSRAFAVTFRLEPDVPRCISS